MPIFRKKLKVVEAIQLNWTNWNEIRDFVEEYKIHKFYIPEDEVSHSCGDPGPRYLGLEVTNPYGTKERINHGDWVIAGEEDGTYYGVTPKYFSETYEPYPIFGFSDSSQESNHVHTIHTSPRDLFE